MPMLPQLGLASGAKAPQFIGWFFPRLKPRATTAAWISKLWGALLIQITEAFWEDDFDAVGVGVDAYADCLREGD